MGRPRGLPLFFFNDTATSEIYTLSLHDALPISSHIDTAKGNLVIDDPTIWFNEPLFKERSHVEIHSGLGVLNWLAIVPDEPTGRKVSTLDSPTSQGPRAFIVNPPACHSACVGRHSPLLTRSPHSHLVPRCRLWQLPPALLSLRPEYLALLSRYSFERSPGRTSPGLWPVLTSVFQTSIVPDEPIRAKGTEWGYIPPHLAPSSPSTLPARQHLRRSSR